MRCYFRVLFPVGLLLALCLSPALASAQQADGTPSPAATAPPTNLPELADLIPLSAGVSDRLAHLKRTGTDSGDLSQVEPQLAEAGRQLDEDAKLLAQLALSYDPRSGQLPLVIGHIEDTAHTLAAINKTVNARVKTLGALQGEWLAEQAQWNAWQPAILSAEPFEEITAALKTAQDAIATALGILRQQLKPLLVLQQQIAGLQSRLRALSDSAQELRPFSQATTAAGAAAPMLSARYRAQLASVLRLGLRGGLVQVAWPSPAFFAQQGWVFVLQAVLSIGLALLFLRQRPRMEQVTDWRFLAARPVAAGVLVGIMSTVIFYDRAPDLVRFFLSAIVAVAFTRLLSGFVEAGWRRRLVYGLTTILVTNNLFYALGIPFAIFRLYLLVGALASLVSCLRWAAESRRLAEAWYYAWVLRLATVLWVIVLYLNVRGEAKAAELLFVAGLRTLGIVLVFGLLHHVVRGAVHWAVHHSAARGATLVRGNATLVGQRLGVLVDVVIGAVLLSVLLMTWQVYDSPSEAITGLLSGQVTIGSQRLTIGIVLLASGSVAAAYLASWLLQTLLTENVLARRNVDIGVSTAVTRLLHYALVSVGFVIALAVLGVDLTKITLLISALGVGIGFGLQTIVNNFVCGLILLFERPLRVGDTIELGGRWAKIAKIGLRSTTVRTLDQADVIVPNADLITNQVTNWTLTDRHARAILAVKVAAGSEVDLVMRTLKECALAHAGVMKTPEPRILFRNLGGGSLDFELHIWIVDVDHRLQVESDLRQEIDHRFRLAGITIPA